MDGTDQKSLKEVLEIQKEQKKFNKDLMEVQQKVLEKLQQIEKEMRKRKRNESSSSCESPPKRSSSTVPIGVTGNNPTVAPTRPLGESGKCFVLKHSFKNITSMKNNFKNSSEGEDHFGIIWKIGITRKKQNLEFYTEVKNKTPNGTWLIEVDREVKLLAKNGTSVVQKSCDIYKQDDFGVICEAAQHGWDNMEWERMKREFLIDDSLTFEVSFKIKRMVGVYKDNMRCFDGPKSSDVVLIVQDKKFHVLKHYLAAHSTYFETMFSSMPGASRRTEIKLDNVDSDDFQNFLEVLYGESAVDENTLEGIAKLSDLYQTPLALKKVEEFLLQKSKKTLKKKLELSVRYGLLKLKKKCLWEIRTYEDVGNVLPRNIRDLDHSTMAELLEKCFYN